MRALISTSSSRVVARKSVLAELQRPDQRAMDDEVGIAADG
jgi:hypothetical protein